MPERGRERLWADALALDWPGDLRALPPVAALGRCLLAIRSRPMLERVRLAGLASDATLLRIVVRNQWADLLDWRDPEQLAYVAAGQGAVWLLQDLFERRRVVEPNADHAVQAALGGHLETVVLLARLMPGEMWGPGVMNAAAGSGSLDLVVWLHEHRPDGCSHMAITKAARGGHHHVVRWLADNRSDGCTPLAVHEAATHGHIDTLVLLHERFPKAFEGLGADAFRNVTSLAVLRWLHAHGLPLDREVVLRNLIKAGDLAGARWACTAFGVRVSQRMMVMACQSDCVSMIKWLLDQPGITVNADAIDAAIAQCAVGTLKLIMSIDDAQAPAIIAKIAASGDPNLLEWLHVRYPGSITHRTLFVAIERRKINAVRYLLESVADVEWDISRASSIARGYSAYAILELLDAHAAGSPPARRSTQTRQRRK
nr:hypothetical protein HK105_007395 [Polyrhizophydium stewartii]